MDPLAYIRQINTKRTEVEKKNTTRPSLFCGVHPPDSADTCCFVWDLCTHERKQTDTHKSIRAIQEKKKISGRERLKLNERVPERPNQKDPKRPKIKTTELKNRVRASLSCGAQPPVISSFNILFGLAPPGGVTFTNTLKHSLR